MDYEQMTAPCGLDCFNCIVYLANDNEEIRVHVSKETNIPVEKVACKGCRNVKGKCPVIPMPCNVYPCAEKKALNFVRTVLIFHATTFIHTRIRQPSYRTILKFLIYA